MPEGKFGEESIDRGRRNSVQHWLVRADASATDTDLRHAREFCVAFALKATRLESCIR
jgi:hypothetical protein